MSDLTDVNNNNNNNSALIDKDLGAGPRLAQLFREFSIFCNCKFIFIKYTVCVLYELCNKRTFHMHWLAAIGLSFKS